jgi:uncharacterized protein YeeX (DUF496 family)|tara:strand:+ start:309 stop:521 length:213 start_codon:yes stop_codon:yes gene_type:complete
MVYAIKLKKQVQRDILETATKIEIDMNKLIAKLELDTGLKKETIVNIIANMKTLNLIRIENNIIKKQGVD